MRQEDENGLVTEITNNNTILYLLIKKVVIVHFQIEEIELQYNFIVKDLQNLIKIKKIYCNQQWVNIKDILSSDGYMNVYQQKNCHDRSCSKS